MGRDSNFHEFDQRAPNVYAFLNRHNRFDWKHTGGEFEDDGQDELP